MCDRTPFRFRSRNAYTGSDEISLPVVFDDLYTVLGVIDGDKSIYDTLHYHGLCGSNKLLVV